MVFESGFLRILRVLMTKLTLMDPNLLRDQILVLDLISFASYLKEFRILELENQV